MLQVADFQGTLNGTLGNISSIFLHNQAKKYLSVNSNKSNEELSSKFNNKLNDLDQISKQLKVVQEQYEPIKEEEPKKTIKIQFDNFAFSLSNSIMKQQSKNEDDEKIQKLKDEMQQEKDLEEEGDKIISVDDLGEDDQDDDLDYEDEDDDDSDQNYYYDNSIYKENQSFIGNLYSETKNQDFISRDQYKNNYKVYKNFKFSYEELSSQLTEDEKYIMEITYQNTVKNSFEGPKEKYEEECKPWEKKITFKDPICCIKYYIKQSQVINNDNNEPEKFDISKLRAQKQKKVIKKSVYQRTKKILKKTKKDEENKFTIDEKILILEKYPQEDTKTQLFKDITRKTQQEIEDQYYSLKVIFQGYYSREQYIEKLKKERNFMKQYQDFLNSPENIIKKLKFDEIEVNSYNKENNNSNNQLNLMQEENITNKKFTAEEKKLILKKWPQIEQRTALKQQLYHFSTNQIIEKYAEIRKYIKKLNLTDEEYLNSLTENRKSSAESANGKVIKQLRKRQSLDKYFKKYAKKQQKIIKPSPTQKNISPSTENKLKSVKNNTTPTKSTKKISKKLQLKVKMVSRQKSKIVK